MTPLLKYYSMNEEKFFCMLTIKPRDYQLEVLHFLESLSIDPIIFVILRLCLILGLESYASS